MLPRRSRSHPSNQRHRVPVEAVGPKILADRGPPTLGALPSTVFRCFAPIRSANLIVTHFVGSGDVQQLADELSRRLDRPVFDMTELAGAFDFTLTWAASGRMRTREGEYIPVGDGTGQTLNEAVERQLGLKLDPRKMASTCW
jgi:uncharacterized protein (TIGR03435 family)